MLCSLLLLAVRQAPAIDPVRAAQIFREAAALSAKDAGKLWGKPLYGPMMFTDPASLTIVTNQPDKDGALRRDGDVYVGKVGIDFQMANFARDWNGVRWTVVIWPLPSLPHSRGRLIMHECFHRIQDSLGLAPGDVSNDHLDEENGRVWMRLEMRALAEAVQTSGTARRQAELDALLFRAERRSLCGDTAAENERRLEMNEGLAEYTGLVLSGFSKASLAARAAVALENMQASDTFARSFAYATGPAYGLLLDEANPNWRRGLRRTDSLPALLAAALKLPSVDPQAATSRMAAYDGVFLATSEHDRAHERALKVAEFRHKFVEGPVLTLPLAQSNYTYDPNDVESLPGIGQVIGSGKVSDDWGTLEVNGGGYLLIRSAAGPTGVAVSSPDRPVGPEAKGPGWVLHLKPGWAIVPASNTGCWTVTKSG